MKNVYSVSIINLKNSAPGYGDVAAGILTLSLPVINISLTQILNCSLLGDVFSSELNISNVLPLYKADDGMLFKNQIVSRKQHSTYMALIV